MPKPRQRVWSYPSPKGGASVAVDLRAAIAFDRTESVPAAAHADRSLSADGLLQSPVQRRAPEFAQRLALWMVSRLSRALSLTSGEPVSSQLGDRGESSDDGATSGAREAAARVEVLPRKQPRAAPRFFRRHGGNARSAAEECHDCEQRDR